MLNADLEISPKRRNLNHWLIIIYPLIFLFGFTTTFILSHYFSPKSTVPIKRPNPTPVSQPVVNPTGVSIIIQPVTPTLYLTPTPKRSGAHYFNNPARAIDNIFVNIVYFIPKGVSPDANWREGLNRNAISLKNFYEREMAQKVTINYSIAPQYVTANNDYNLAIPNTSPDYENGCSAALNSAMKEIKLKVNPPKTGDLNLWVVVFESLPCALALPIESSLLVPGYIIDHTFEVETPQSPSPTGVLMSHEFGHLLGIPDSYNQSEDYLHNNVVEPFCDIMSHCQGDGKFHSINQLFLSDKNKKALGI